MAGSELGLLRIRVWLVVTMRVKVSVIIRISHCTPVGSTPDICSSSSSRLRGLEVGRLGLG